MEQYSNIELLTEPSASNHVITVGYGDAHYAALEHSHTLSEITDAAAALATLATKAALTAYVKTTEMNSALTAYVTSQNLGTILESYALTATLANYATSASVSQLRNYVDSTFASVTTVRGMIEGALTGYVSPSSLEASLANYAVKVHTHTSAQISDATRTGGQNADAGKAVLLSDGGKIAGEMVPVDGASVVLSNGTISVSDSWLEGEVHGYTKTEVSAVSGTVLNLTKSGQVFDKSLSADATITLNTSGLVVDTGEVVEFDLFLTLGEGVTAHLPGWMTDKGPIYNYAEEGKTLFHVWSYDGGTTWNASKESWLPPDNWKWVTTLSDAIGHQGTSLRDAIGAASSGDVIKFLPELAGTITLEQGQLSVAKRLTIDGGGKITIDAHGVSRCFECSNSSDGSVLRGVNLANGYALNMHGGCLLVMKGITLEKCRITGGSAEANAGTCFGGGAMFRGAVSMTDCTVTECSASSSANNAYGGAVMIYDGTDDAILTDCVISSSSSSSSSMSDCGALGFIRNAKLTMTRCRIENNTGQIGGVLVQNLSGDAVAEAEITDCVFKGNQTITYGAALRFGTISSVKVTGCRFENNTSATGTAGIVVFSSSGEVTVEDCVFTGNTGLDGVSIASGVNSRQYIPVTVARCRFTGETGRTGIVSFRCSALEIRDCVFEENAFVNSALSIIGYDGQAGGNFVERCRFTGNVGTGGAGLIYARTGCDVTVSDCVFTSNNGEANKNAAVYTESYAEATVRSCTMTDGYRAVNSANNTTITCYNCVDVGNANAPSGGGTRVYASYLTDQTVAGDDIIAYDDSLPLFDEDGYTPLEGSQTIDAGNSEYVDSETDFNGDPRIQGTAVDLGAVEYGGDATVNLSRLSLTNRLNRLNNISQINTADIDLDREDLDATPIDIQPVSPRQDLNGGEQR